MCAIRECLLTGKWHNMPYKEYLPVQNELSCVGYLILRGTRIVIPNSLRDKILQSAHLGHPGIVSMKQSLRTRVWWPGMDQHAQDICKSCYGCQLVSKPSQPEPMTPMELPA